MGLPEAGGTAEQKHASRFRDALGGGCLVLFFLPFLAGGLVAIGLVAWESWLTWRAQSWVEARCFIDEAELVESPGGDAVTYKNRARYHYDYGGQTYRGTRVDFNVGSDDLGDFHHRLHADLEAHRAQARPFACFVNPEDPPESVLHRGLRPGKIAMGLAFGLAFGAIGVGGLALMLRPVSRRRPR